MKKLGFVCLFLLSMSSCGKETLLSSRDSIPESGPSVSGSDQDSPEGDKDNQDDTSVERPSDLDLALHAVAAWSVEPEIYYDKINLEELEQNPESFTLEQWKELVNIKAVTYDKGVYHFTEDDLLNVRLVNVKWNRTQQKIEFKLAYKNITGRNLQSLPFNLADYYAVRFKVNSSFVETHYLHGVYQYAGSFLGNLLKFDSDRYLPELYSKGIDIRNNTMTVTFSVYDRQANRDLNIQVTKELRGFKTQDELLKSIMIGATAAVHEQAVEVMARYDGKKELKEYLKSKVLNKKWMQLMEYSIGNQQLFYSEQQPDKFSHSVEVISGRGSHLDVYLENPVWRLETAELEGRHLKLRMGLYSVNHIALTGVSYKIVIPNVIQ